MEKIYGKHNTTGYLSLNDKEFYATLKFSSVNPCSVLASLIIAATYRFMRFFKTS